MHPLERVLSMALRFIVPEMYWMHELRPGKDADRLDEARKRLLKLAEPEYKKHVKGWQTWEAKVAPPANGGEPCTVFVHRPAGAGAEPLPLVFWIHGGGFTIGGAGDAMGAEGAAKLLARGVPAVWASVEYSLAPEKPFPAAFDECLHSLQAFVRDEELAKQYGYDRKNVHLAGLSAGGALVAGLVYELQRLGGEDLAAVRSALVREPFLEPLMNTDAYVENGDMRTAPVPWLQWSWECYCSGVGGVEAARADPRICPQLHKPVVAPGGRFIPLLVTTAMADCLRDEGRAYVQTMRTAGAEVCHIEARGAHGTGFMFDRQKGEAMLSEWENLLRRPA